MPLFCILSCLYVKLQVKPLNKLGFAVQFRLFQFVAAFQVTGPENNICYSLFVGWIFNYAHIVEKISAIRFKSWNTISIALYTWDASAVVCIYIMVIGTKESCYLKSFIQCFGQITVTFYLARKYKVQKIILVNLWAVEHTHLIPQIWSLWTKWGLKFPHLSWADLKTIGFSI
jgi:hypothetical protein